MKFSEDELCRIFAEKVRESSDFQEWVLSRTKFAGRSAKLLHEDQILSRPNVKPENWWRHWWRKIPELSQERETDIFLVFEDKDGSRFALHIENKQGAKFTAGQAEDYASRARWMMGQERYLNYSDFQTILIAPRQVKLKNPDKADMFDCFIAYEDLALLISQFGAVAVPR